MDKRLFKSSSHYFQNPKHQVFHKKKPTAHQVFWAVGILLGLFMLGCETDELEDRIHVEKPGFQGIVGGFTTNYQTWQGAVGIKIPQGAYAYSICTATLIDPEVILSAGHCVYLPSRGVNVLNNPTAITIVGGADMEITYSLAEEVVKHPNWNGDIYAPNRVDLSVIKLATPIEDVEPYPIDTEPLTVNMEGIIVGYGNSSDSGGTGIHRYGDTTILQIVGNEFELGNPAGTCMGDSGGPLFVNRQNNWALAGVSSYGAGETCLALEGSWDVYVLNYRDWIADVVFGMTGRALIEIGQDTEKDSDSDIADSDDGVSTEEETDEGPEFSSDPTTWLDTDSPLENDPEASLLTDGGITHSPFGMNQKNPLDCRCQSTGNPGSSVLINLLLSILF